MSDVGIVGNDKSTLAEREIIHSIEQIGLSHTITADEAVYLRRQRNIDVGQILVIQQ